MNEPTARRWARGKTPDGRMQIRDVTPTGATGTVLTEGDTVIAEVLEAHSFAPDNKWVCSVNVDPGIKGNVGIPAGEFKRQKELLGTKIVCRVTVPFTTHLLLHYVSKKETANGPLEVSPILSQIDLLNQEIEEAKRPIIRKLQELFNGLSGSSFIDDDKQQVVSRLQDLLNSLDLRVQCPKTSLPGFIRLKQAGLSRRKTFAVEVNEDGKRTSHFSSMTFPHLIVVPAPPDGRKKN